LLPLLNDIATICKDGINANRKANGLYVEKKTLTANDALQIHLAPAEGFLIRVKKE